MTTLEKIKTEIEAVEPKSHVQYGMRWADTTLMIPFHKVMQIIDKYAEQEPCEVSEYDKDHIWYKGHQYISLRRFLEVKAEAEQEPTYDKLSFPKTFDELVEQYGIIDTDEVYTNGLKLIPAFRVKQWLMEANINGYTEGLKDASDVLTVSLPIPDNATNGEVIKAMFGDDKVSEFMCHTRIIAKVGNWFNKGVVAEFDNVWWNAPYQKGGKE